MDPLRYALGGDVVQELQRMYDQPPHDAIVGGHLLSIYDPEGENDFAINFSYGEVSTLEGRTIQEVVNAARAGEGEVMVEIFVHPLHDDPIPLESGSAQVTFPSAPDLSALAELQWTVTRLEDDDPDWEINAMLRV